MRCTIPGCPHNATVVLSETGGRSVKGVLTFSASKDAFAFQYCVGHKQEFDDNQERWKKICEVKV